MSDLNPNDIRMQLVNDLPLECRDLGKNFFECIETKMDEMQHLLTPNISYEDLDKFVNEKVLPQCAEKYDVASCVNKYSK